MKSLTSKEGEGHARGERFFLGQVSFDFLGIAVVVGEGGVNLGKAN
jgi:hypothetical protein